MPSYEFVCEKCGKAFELNCSVAEYEQKKKGGIKCLHCNSSKIMRQVSAFQVQTAKKS
jgi:putative FmdB family regulatory protein